MVGVHLAGAYDLDLKLINFELKTLDNGLSKRNKE